MRAAPAPRGAGWPQLPDSVMRGLSFGLTSGVLTTLGLIIGLYSGTGSVHAVAAGVLTIAITDAISDAMGIHISEESAGAHVGEVWVATAATFIAKLGFALTFLVPVLLLSLGAGILVAIAWGVSLLTVFSWYIATRNGDRPSVVIGEHLGVAVLVIAAAQLAGWAIDSLV